MNHKAYDIAVAGAGVIGCALTRSLLLSRPGLRICLIEKEPGPAMHQSSHNSNVVHVGYNQKPGTIKAKFVVDGSKRLRTYCREKGLPLAETGILVIARSNEELSTLEELHKRAISNGASTTLLAAEDIAKYEPHAKGVAALYAPEGASFDSKRFVLSVAEEAESMGADIIFSEPVLDLKETDSLVAIQTGSRRVEARIFINAAGLHADRLAHMMDVGNEFKIIPFRGEYWNLIDSKRELVRSHIYPAPDLQFPFLGVHLSKLTDGRVMLGPSSVLALGREAYRFWAVDFKDTSEMLLSSNLWTMLASKDMRRLVKMEWKKSMFPKTALTEARQLVAELQPGDLVRGTSGIRAQLVGKAGELIDDMLLVDTPRSIHILNAVSPALTCSLPFADDIRDKVLERL